MIRPMFTLQGSSDSLLPFAFAAMLGLAVAGMAQAETPGASPVGGPKMSAIALDGAAMPQGIVTSEGAEPTVWFAAAQRSAVGEVDVASGTVGYIALGHGAKPRGLARCPNGRLYALDPALNVIHEIVPATEEVTRHPMPGGQTADLSGAVCTASNLLLFTGYNGWLGKLDTASGVMTVVEAQGLRGPSQIVKSASGSVWFASYASNQIVRVDPASLRQDAFPMPAGVEGPKGLAVDGTGRIWVSAFRSARIARFDPRRRSWDAWPLGEGARPFAVIPDSRGGILVSDVGHDTLLRLDATTGSSSTVAKLSERGQARSMARLGDQVWITESAVDKLTIVDFAAPPSN